MFTINKVIHIFIFLYLFSKWEKVIHSTHIMTCRNRLNELSLSLDLSLSIRYKHICCWVAKNMNKSIHKNVQTTYIGMRKCDYYFRFWTKLVNNDGGWVVKLIYKYHNHNWEDMLGFMHIRVLCILGSFSNLINPVNN